MPNLLDSSTAIDPVQLSFIQWLYEAEREKQNAIALYRDYYDGEHGTKLTDRQRAYLSVKGDIEFHVNYCPIVVDAEAERLNVTGFDVQINDGEQALTDDARDAAADAESELMWQWWQQNRMDATQGIVHTAGLRDGETFMLVSWDNVAQMPVFTHEPACVGAVGVKVHFNDDTREIEFASKRWLVEQGSETGKMRRLNLYYPNRIEKYYSHSEEDKGQWQQYREVDANDNELPWPAPWTIDGTVEGDPLGVPVIPFFNRDQGWNEGQSELKDVIPIQNALNKTVIDSVAAADTSAFRLLYKIGGQDPTSLKFAPGMVLYDPADGADEQVSWGSFEPVSLNNFIQLADAKAVEIARVTRTPMTAFQLAGGTQRIAAETLRQMDAGMVAKVRRLQVAWGNAWEDMMQMARKLHNTFGQEGANYRAMSDSAMLSTMWTAAEIQDELATLQALKAKRDLGIPLERLWMEAGYSAQEIDEMKATDEYKAMLAQQQLSVTDNMLLGAMSSAA